MPTSRPAKTVSSISGLTAPAATPDELGGQVLGPKRGDRRRERVKDVAVELAREGKDGASVVARSR